MNILDITRAAVGNTFRSKTRTTLTVTAIFIGAFTLTITSAIGTGISSYIDNQISAVGAKDVLSITKAADDAAPAGGGPTPYDPEEAVVTAEFVGNADFATSLLEADDLET